MNKTNSFRSKGIWLNVFETEDGKSRLAAEKSVLESTGCCFDAVLLPDGRLGFKLKFPYDKDAVLIVVCQKNHPSSFPDLFISYRGDYIEALNFASLQKNEIIPFKVNIEPKVLRKNWEQPGSTIMIADIVRAFDFSGKGKTIKRNF